jgi:hypothetical protein
VSENPPVPVTTVRIFWEDLKWMETHLKKADEPWTEFFHRMREIAEEESRPKESSPKEQVA